MYYKAIVVDFDRTLMISKNKDLLVKIHSVGIKVILASGRPTNKIIKN